MPFLTMPSGGRPCRAISKCGIPAPLHTRKYLAQRAQQRKAMSNESSRILRWLSFGSKKLPSSNIEHRGTAKSSIASISRAALDAIPNSLLSVLSKKRWQQQNAGEDGSVDTVGSSATSPICVEVFRSPCQKEWSPKFVDWIPKIYDARLKVRNEPNPSVACTVRPYTEIPEDIELENAWSVLDYFGIAPDHPSDIDISQSRKIVQIRAGLFLRYIDEVKSATDFILDDLIKSPYKDKYYVFVSSSHDIGYIKAKNYRGPIPVVQLGKPGDADKHYEWVQNPKYRSRFFADLKGEGLKVKFLSGLEFSTSLDDLVGDYTFEGSGWKTCHNCGEYGHIASECPISDPRYTLKYVELDADMCWASTRDADAEGRSSHFEGVYVIHIHVPSA